MSHEGIRFISPDDHAHGEHPKFTGDAIRPAKIRVDKTGGTGMSIDWKDGHTSAWNFAWLRAACPCATCHEERDKEHRAPGVTKLKPVSLLQMYEDPPRPREVSPVGKYAIRFTWNDGHEAGLYSWDYLRNVCDTEVKKQTASSL